MLANRYLQPQRQQALDEMGRLQQRLEQLITADAP